MASLLLAALLGGNDEEATRGSKHAPITIDLSSSEDEMDEESSAVPAAPAPVPTISDGSSDDDSDDDSDDSSSGGSDDGSDDSSSGSDDDSSSEEETPVSAPASASAPVSAPVSASAPVPAPTTSDGSSSSGSDDDTSSGSGSDDDTSSDDDSSSDDDGSSAAPASLPVSLPVSAPAFAPASAPAAPGADSIENALDVLKLSKKDYNIYMDLMEGADEEQVFTSDGDDEEDDSLQDDDDSIDEEEGDNVGEEEEEPYTKDEIIRAIVSTPLKAWETNKTGSGPPWKKWADALNTLGFTRKLKWGEAFEKVGDGPPIIKKTTAGDQLRKYIRPQNGAAAKDEYEEDEVDEEERETLQKHEQMFKQAQAESRLEQLKKEPDVIRAKMDFLKSLLEDTSVAVGLLTRLKAQLKRRAAVFKGIEEPDGEDDPNLQYKIALLKAMDREDEKKLFLQAELAKVAIDLEVAQKESQEMTEQLRTSKFENIFADDDANFVSTQRRTLASLKKQLEEEQDPEWKEQIQTQIDKWEEELLQVRKVTMTPTEFELWEKCKQENRTRKKRRIAPVLVSQEPTTGDMPGSLKDAK